MCDECLECRDPDIYCKFRASCPVWFMTKKIKGLDEEEKIVEEAKQCRVLFHSDNKETEVAEGSTLPEAAVKADVYINASCNGKGSFGTINHHARDI